eukprot:CAMPEP_0115091724 /NCGR_PEP_ID=MMETSP0227-20121206/26294_1 /TAXON_ID=89957 /ORGANISM="Polarella glacialis, Strain CCMP 1383" /LENGTH=139 /DNA_ID=CAMNT_0002483313 /DNA_START=47 /DNA_END=466 /DNA_ORIENTATION=+
MRSSLADEANCYEADDKHHAADDTIVPAHVNTEGLRLVLRHLHILGTLHPSGGSHQPVWKFFSRVAFSELRLGALGHRSPLQVMGPKAAEALGATGKRQESKGKSGQYTKTLHAASRASDGDLHDSDRLEARGSLKMSD